MKKDSRYTIKYLFISFISIITIQVMIFFGKQIFNAINKAFNWIADISVITYNEVIDFFYNIPDLFKSLLDNETTKYIIYAIIFYFIIATICFSIYYIYIACYFLRNEFKIQYEGIFGCDKLDDQMIAKIVDYDKNVLKSMPIVSYTIILIILATISTYLLTWMIAIPLTFIVGLVILMLLREHRLNKLRKHFKDSIVTVYNSTLITRIKLTGYSYEQILDMKKDKENNSYSRKLAFNFDEMCFTALFFMPISIGIITLCVLGMNHINMQFK